MTTDTTPTDTTPTDTTRTDTAPTDTTPTDTTPTDTTPTDTTPTDTTPTDTTPTDTSAGTGADTPAGSSDAPEPPSPPTQPEWTGLAATLGVSSWPVPAQDLLHKLDWDPPKSLMNALPHGHWLRKATDRAKPLLLPLAIGLILLPCCCIWCCCRRRRRRRRWACPCGRRKGIDEITQFEINMGPIAPDSPSHRGSGLEMDVLVDDAPELLSDSDAEGRPRVRPGDAAKVCTYEELGENTLSDCSAEDFETPFGHPTRRANSSHSGASSVNGGPRRVGAAKPPSAQKQERSTEKRSLLTDVDILVI